VCSSRQPSFSHTGHRDKGGGGGVRQHTPSRSVPPPADPTAGPGLPPTDPAPYRVSLPDHCADLGEEPTPVLDEATGCLFVRHPGATDEQLQAMKALVGAKATSFAHNWETLGRYTGDQGPFTIDLSTDSPVFEKPRRQSELERQVMREKCADLVRVGIIEPCPTTRYASNTVIVPKKAPDGSLSHSRMCHDYRPANRVTPQDRHPMRMPEDMFQQVGTCAFLSKIDLRSGYLEIPVLPAHRDRTAFWLCGQLYQYTTMPFGLKNACAKFQRVMDYEIAKAGLSECCLAWVDDLLIYSETADGHLRDVGRVLDMLAACGQTAHPEKSVFFTNVIEYLGHNVSSYGLTPLQAKVAAIQALTPPTNLTELRSKFGLMNYYRVYCPHFSAIAAPLTQLMSPKRPYVWGEEQQTAWEAAKATLCEEGRALRRFAPNRPTVLHTDWSNHGIGAVLGQEDEDGNEYMVACVSRSLNVHEKNYSSYQGEMLAAVWGVKTMRHYLAGHPFRLVTDHQPLQYLMSNPSLTGMHARWALSLQDFEFKVEHRPGSTHQNADVPSRFPLTTTADATDARAHHDGADPPPSPLTLAVQSAGSHRWAPAFTAELTRAPAPAAIAHAKASIEAHAAAERAATAAAHPAAMFMDSIAPRSNQLLSGHAGFLSDPALLPEEPLSTAQQTCQVLQLKAANWARAAGSKLRGLPPFQPSATAISDTVVAATFFPAAKARGVTLFEPFGGLCAGLEMVLRNGVHVTRYIYADSSPAARRVAAHRAAHLSATYPDLLPHSATRSMLTSIPQNVRDIDTAQLLQAGAADGTQWLLVAGWECQDLSAAGGGAGLFGKRSRTFFDLTRILGALQRLQPALPPGYLLENAPMQHNWQSQPIREVFPTVCAAIGTPTLVDAAQMGSFAHRLRNWWSNLAAPARTACALSYVKRDPNRFVNSILDPGRFTRPVARADTFPMHTCNLTSLPMAALPTFVSFPASHAFRDEGLGVLIDKSGSPCGEPNPDERERAMGYDTGATAAPGLSPRERHTITGRCMDSNTTSRLFALYAALAHAQALALPPPPTPAEAAPNRPPEAPVVAALFALPTAPDGMGAGVACALAMQPLALGLAQHTHAVLFAAAAAEKADAMPAARADVWDDEPVLHFLRTGTHTSDASAADRHRATRRAQAYSFSAGTLRRTLPDGSTRVVPPPADREQLVRDTHETCGHFGESRTRSLLLTGHWWSGVSDVVHQVVSRCQLCDRVNSSLNAEQPQLNPLPSMGLMYRWGCDLCGPFPTSRRGHTYIMVMVEYFSKYIELAPLPRKTAECTATAFRSCVLGRYAACAECVTDGGSEWLGQFHDLLESAFIDHRTTSPDHPQADGQTERAVQVVKRALKKHCASTGSNSTWDNALPWVQLGYNCSVQSSTRFSPYHLLFCHQPVVPPAIKQRMEQPLNFDDPEAATASLQARADALKQACAIAGDNILIAQHRQSLQYARRRGGSYTPRLHRFEPGDFVYLKVANPASSLQIRVRSDILRVVEVRSSGVLILQGKCGLTAEAHVTGVVPCHLPDLDPTVDPTLAACGVDKPCEVCDSPARPSAMQLCDACNTGWHMFCLQPVLISVPKGVWLCPRCVTLGVDRSTIELRAAARETAPVSPPQPVLFPNAPMRRRDEAAAAFHGRVITRTFSVGGRPATHWGSVAFLGAEARPYYFRVTYQDGDIEDVTLARLLPWLCPPGTALPVAATFYAGVLALTTPAVSLPDTWTVATTAGCAAALRHFMPGSWPLEAVRSMVDNPAQPPWGGSAVPAAALVALHDGVNLAAMQGILDPWESTGVAHALRAAGMHVHALEATTLMPHMQPHQPSFWQGLTGPAAVDAVVSAPITAVLDLVIPLAVAFSRQLTCFWVPRAFLAAAPSPRRAWLRSLAVAGRLRVLEPDLPGATPGVWLAIARDASIAFSVFWHGPTDSREGVFC
jgi:hypothetical protein